MNDLEKRVQRLERILDVSQKLTSTLALGPLLRTIANTAAELTESEDASIILWDARTGELHFRASAGELTDQLADIPVPVEGSIAGTVLNSGEPLIVSDAKSDPRHYGEVGRQIGREIHSLVAAPMQIKERCIGMLEAVNKHGGQEFTSEDVETLMVLGAQAVVAIESARLIGALQEAYDRLGKLDQLKSDFIAIASHELRTPLSLILGYATLLRGQLDATARGQIDVVFRAAMQLKRLIETMLNLRYLETGEVELLCASFDLRKEIWGASRSYRSLAEANRLTLELLQTGGTHQMADLARKLDTTPALVEAMLEDLARMGYLKRVGGECGGGCTSCSLAGMCAVGGGQVWTLTEKEATAKPGTCSDRRHCGRRYGGTDRERGRPLQPAPLLCCDPACRFHIFSTSRGVLFLNLW